MSGNTLAQASRQPVPNMDTALHRSGQNTHINTPDVVNAQKLTKLAYGINPSPNNPPSDQYQQALKNNAEVQRAVGGQVSSVTIVNGNTVITGANGTSLTIVPEPGRPDRTGALVVKTPDGQATVAFPGTRRGDTADQTRNLDAGPVTLPDGSRAHRGFNNSAERIAPQIMDLTQGCSSVTITGHSAGAAIGEGVARHLQPPSQQCKIITFGGPPAGDQAFYNGVSSRTGNPPDYVRVIHEGDPVPSLGFPQSFNVNPVILGRDNQLYVGNNPNAGRIGALIGTALNRNNANAWVSEHHSISGPNGYGAIASLQGDGQQGPLPTPPPHNVDGPPLIGGGTHLSTRMQQLVACCSMACRTAANYLPAAAPVLNAVAAGLDMLRGAAPPAPATQPQGPTGPSR